MINKLSKYLTEKLLSNGDIDKNEQELYVYGLFMLISHLMLFVLSCIFSLIFGCLFEGISFYIAFQLIRKYAGGYHASTETACEIMSTLSVLVCIIFIKLSITYSFQLPLLIITIISAVTIFVLCPLDTPEKPLTKKEYHYFRKISWVILLVLLALMILSYIFKWKVLFAPVCLSLILESILLIAGRIKKIYQRKKNIVIN
jgi:accessory gene regulator B